MPPVIHSSVHVSDTIQRQISLSHLQGQILEEGQSSGQSVNVNSLRQPLSAQSNGASTPNTDHSRQDRRVLPTRAVTDENLDEVYLDFVMYCNPSISTDTDSTELRKIFRAPPKSDGKSFSTFTLFELIRKLELKEIKTWAQLVIELGVEPPVLEKRQSAQKVQQYAVRLKRWMHAMHVDAFFEYLLNKPHVYWTQVPSINDPVSEFGRDGVPAEEDLALRALLPETRPKRGRRKVEDRDNDSDNGKSPSQRPRVHSPSLSEDFMLARASLGANNVTPATAHPGFNQGYDKVDPWPSTDVGGSMASSFQWRGPDSAAQTPISTYAQSALTPTNTSQLWNDEPHSGIPPNKPRSRRRHGPAVSSAWPSNGNGSAGKLRGRPPTNRSTVDGPFSTFPANRSSRDVPMINLRDSTPAATPVTSSDEIPHFFPSTLKVPDPPDSIPQGGRPNRLQLQVPEHQGGSIRLATPPPVLLVNGESNTTMQQSSMQEPLLIHPNDPPMLEYFTLNGDLDPSFEHFVSVAFRQNEDADRTNVDALESHFISEILAAQWYDAAGNNIERCHIDEAAKICKQVVKNLQAESSSTQTFLINLSALAGGPLTTRLKMTRLDYESRIDYECYWKMRFGSIEGDFTIRASVGRSPDSVVTEQHGPGDTEQTWKQRYLDLQQQIKERDEKVGKLKRGVLDALLVSNQYIPF